MASHSSIVLTGHWIVLIGHGPLSNMCSDSQEEQILALMIIDKQPLNTQ